MKELFKNPLAAVLRPNNLQDFVGQKHLLAEGKILREMIENDNLSSIIFWGPPGVGKTTLALIIAQKTKTEFLNLSAVNTSSVEIKKLMEKAKNTAQKTIIFIDEIHRFSKSQQDIFLPYVEDGSIILIGATTENPSFELNNALLSRCKVFVLEALSVQEIEILLRRASDKIPYQIENIEDFIAKLAIYADGDARNALNILELIVKNSPIENEIIKIAPEALSELGLRNLRYDKSGDEHYNLISALHKSLRNSDVDAAIYWLFRMLEGGENPLYIARRLIRFAAEDIGLADNNALNLCINVFQACQFLGMPECDVHLTQAVIYLALSPKSNSAYKARNEALQDVKKTINEPVPFHIRNASTKLMRDLDYGKNYQYAHDYELAMTAMSTIPNSLKNKQYYYPSEQGNEVRFKERLLWIKDWKKNNK